MPLAADTVAAACLARAAVAMAPPDVGHQAQVVAHQLITGAQGAAARAGGALRGG